MDLKFINYAYFLPSTTNLHKFSISEDKFLFEVTLPTRPSVLEVTFSTRLEGPSSRPSVLEGPSVLD